MTEKEKQEFDRNNLEFAEIKLNKTDKPKEYKYRWGCGFMFGGCYNPEGTWTDRYDYGCGFLFGGCRQKD